VVACADDAQAIAARLVSEHDSHSSSEPDAVSPGSPR
jgi:hypothetical protein